MPSPVPFVDLRRQQEPIQGALTNAFERVVGATSFILGEEVERFESEFAAYCGVKHCVGVGSGTAALALSFTAAGIGPGDEVIVPAHTFIASALGVIHAGATPVLCDVHDADGLIDVATAEPKVTERTAAVLPVHLYGQIADMAAVGEFAERHGLAVIEDAAQAHGATSDGRRAGSSGLASAFSFYPSKNLGALGDGGAICTDDDELAESARMLRNLGQRRKGEHEVVGYNERLDGLQAAFLRVKLPHLDGWNEARREHARAYREGLGTDFVCLDERAGVDSIYHLFPVRVDDRDALARRLAERDIHTGVHYAPSLDMQPALEPVLSDGDEYPVAAAWAGQELSLPMFESLSTDEIDRVLAACNA